MMQVYFVDTRCTIWVSPNESRAVVGRSVRRMLGSTVSAGAATQAEQGELVRAMRPEVFAAGHVWQGAACGLRPCSPRWSCVRCHLVLSLPSCNWT